MGPIALLLKHTFNVPCYFYMHTDWIEFIKHTTQLSHSERDRMRRLLRFFYQRFDGIFVLNSDHKQWLCSHEMQIPQEQVFLTSHWLKEPPAQTAKINIHKLHQEIGLNSNEPTPTLLFAGRISQEKGIFDIPDIFRQVKKKIPNIQMVIAGSGPAEYAMRKEFPEATYLGWVPKKKIRQLYQSLDLFIFPSRFDTFGNVVLEAFGHGMPVIAYNLKGPKDIIEHGNSGFLVEDKEEMAQTIINYFSDAVDRQDFKNNAIERSQSKLFRADTILDKLQKQIQLID